ncbi:MAG: hypothetical protein ACFFAO_02140 [Candidatus Hermodarchaeota archaeon]
MINLTNNQVKALNLFSDFYISSLYKSDLDITIKINPYDNVIIIIFNSKYLRRRYYIKKNRIACISMRLHGIKKKSYTYKLKKR